MYTYKFFPFQWSPHITQIIYNYYIYMYIVKICRLFPIYFCTYKNSFISK